MDQLIDNNVTATTTGDGGLFGSGFFEGENTTYSIDSWSATTGCLDPSASNGGDGSWGGTSGGSCANMGTNGDGAIRFGYNNTIVSQTQDIINDALKVAGVQVVGYLWQWKVKNYNANDTSGTQVNNQDPLYVRVIVKDNDGNIVDEREWDYSYSISDWEQKNGMHWYNPFLMGDEVDSLTIEVEGRDAGYWAGWWGPEFREAGIYSIFVYREPLDCSDPLNDPTCPGYATALQEQQEAMLAEQLAMAEMTNDTGTTNQIDETSRTAETVEEVQPEPEPVAEVVEEIVEEIIEETAVIEEPVQEIVTETQTSNSTSKIRVNPLDIANGAVADAAAVASNAVNSAITSSIQSDQQSTNFVMEQVQESAELSFEMEEQLIENIQTIASNVSQQQFAALNLEENVLQLEIIVEDVNVETTSEALNNIISQITSPTFELKLPESKEEIPEPMSTMEEAELVAKAYAGSDDEDARSALLGYNPLFSQYQQLQMADADFYKPKEIYPNQKNHDNPNSRFFNGASDEKHNALVRMQYDNR
jgi:DNA polymerase III delta prime subunit